MSKTRILAYLLATTITTSAVIAPAAWATEPAPFKLDTAATQPLAQQLDTATALRKIGADRYDLFFGGEFQSRSLPFFALPDEASTPSKLVLTLQTAISVAPEQSSMKVAINGTPVGSTGLVAGDPRRIEFSVPVGVIHPGYNAVTIEADQRHRVDCSLNATYELWTKIDPDKSGFVYASVPKPNLSLVDLLPLSGTTAGRTAIRVVLPADVEMTAYDRAMNVVQALTILGNFNHPSVEFAKTPGVGPGIDLYIGTKSELTPMLGDGSRVLASKDHIIIDSSSNDERKRLILTGMDANDLNVRAQEFAAAARTDRPVGTREGLAALTNLKGRTLVPGDKVRLSELGYSGKRFSGRLAVSQLNFSMPSDFYPGDYSAINFHLNALYVGGLAPDAVLVVKANDKEVANIQLSSPREGEIRDQRLPIPFSVLRPGQNTLTIEARVPSRLDAACDSVDKASSAVRLFINENSYLDVPDYARIGRYPDIAGLTSGLSPMQADETDPLSYIFVPGYDKKAMNAAATFIAKMAFSSDKVKPVEFTSVLPNLDTANVIAFGSYDTLPSELTARMKLDFVNIRADANTIQKSVEVASLDTLAPPLETPVSDDLTGQPAPSRLAVLTSLAEDFAADPAKLSGQALAHVKIQTMSEMHKLNLKYLPSLLEQGRDDTYSPPASASLVVAQNSTANGAVWTVVAARNADAIEAQTDVLTDYNVWNKLGGAVQSFTDTGDVIDQKKSKDEHLFATEPLTLSNARLIAAGWLANNAEIYIGALLAAAVLLGIGTFMVLVTGRRNHG